MKPEDKELIENIISQFKERENGVANAMSFTEMFKDNPNKRVTITRILIDDYNFIDRVGNHSYRLNTNGWNFTSFSDLDEIESKKVEREAVELENLRLNTTLNSWLLKTKWWPLIISIIAILASIYLGYKDESKKDELEKRIIELERQLKK